jgi:hypothetical protein
MWSTYRNDEDEDREKILDVQDRRKYKKITMQEMYSPTYMHYQIQRVYP